MSKESRFGFWWHSSQPELPVPRASIYDNTKIVSRLKKIQAICEDESQQRGGQIQVVGYRGWSSCRICQKANGSREYMYLQDGVQYIWPSGLIHYLEDHDIEPPQALRDLVDFHSLAWKLVRHDAKNELFPFNVNSRISSNQELIEIWNSIRPKGLFWNSVSAQIQSETQVRLVVIAAGFEEPVHDEVMVVKPEQIQDIIQRRKYDIAEIEYNARRDARKEYDVEKIMKEIFGEPNGKSAKRT